MEIADLFYKIYNPDCKLLSSDNWYKKICGFADSLWPKYQWLYQPVYMNLNIYDEEEIDSTY